MNNEELAKAITAAIKEGFESIKSSGGLGGGSNTPEIKPDSLPDTETQNKQNESIENLNSNLEETNKQSKDAAANIKTVGGAFTGIVGSLTKLAVESTKTYLDAAASLSDEFDDKDVGELGFLRQIQESFGGVKIDAYAAGEAVEGLAGQALDAELHLGLVGSAGKESALKIESGAFAGENALLAMFKNPLEPAKLFSQVMVDVAETNTTLAQSLEAQGEAEMERIALIRKRMAIDERTMGNILRRQYAFTGEASSKIFEDIAAVSTTLAKQTGGAANDLKSDILDIMQDTKMFGDIGVDSAGRIAASLNQLGLDFQTFKSMTSQFMNFDSAAEKMGDLSALFGIQMDAMEMTYLANEDQEEFLFRMREEILDAGLDVENMSKTRQRALTEQLGLQSIEQMQQFMDTGIQPDQMAMEAATTEAETMDGMATAIEGFGGAYEGAHRNAQDFEKSLRIQARYADGVAQDLAKVRIESGKITQEFQDFQIPKEAITNARKMLAVDMKGIQGLKDNLGPIFKDLTKATADASAKVVEAGFDAAGIKPLTSGEVKFSGDVQVQLDEIGKQTSSEVLEAAKQSNERSAELENRTMELAETQIGMQSEVTQLIETLQANQNINMKLELNASQMGSRLFKVIQEQNGGNIVINPAT